MHDDRLGDQAGTDADGEPYQTDRRVRQRTAEPANHEVPDGAESSNVAHAAGDQVVPHEPTAPAGSGHERPTQPPLLDDPERALVALCGLDLTYVTSFCVGTLKTPRSAFRVFCVVPPNEPLEVPNQYWRINAVEIRGRCPSGHFCAKPYPADLPDWSDTWINGLPPREDIRCEKLTSLDALRVAQPRELWDPEFLNDGEGEDEPEVLDLEVFHDELPIPDLRQARIEIAEPEWVPLLPPAGYRPGQTVNLDTTYPVHDPDLDDVDSNAAWLAIFDVPKPTTSSGASGSEKHGGNQ